MSQKSVPLSFEQVRLLRVRAQRLDSHVPSGIDVARTVKELCGVQAQDAGAAPLAIRARTRGLTAADVERALVDERSIVRTWVMRGTLHFVATEDLGWLLPLLGAGFAAADGRRRAQLGLDEPASRRGVAVIRDALAQHGPLTRAALAERLARHGLPSTGQAPIHLIYLAALQGLLCLGPNRAGKPTYVLLADWVAPGDLRAPLPREQAIGELARRYLSAYAPATIEDFATWSGLPLGEARSAWKSLAGELIEVEVEGMSGAGAAWMPQTHAARLDAQPGGDASPNVRLAPSFDPYLLGYRSRNLAVASEYARRIHPGGGMLHPALLVDGRATGTWRIKRLRTHLEVVVSPFAADAASAAAEIEEKLTLEIADVGRFLG